MFNFVLFLMQGIPESIGLAALSLALTGIPLRWGRVLAIGIVMTLIIYLIRLLPVTFGLHTVAAILLYISFIIKITNVPATRVFIAVFTSFAILIALEVAIFEAFLFFSNMEPEEVISNKLLWLGLGMPQAFILIFLAIVAARLKRPAGAVFKQ
ncbi:hypothetical protein Psch_02165 [Pelotomaculum schinkii]|uniref:Uncharacterized protein n=1 Tax=Pelotomaculum schinkii TaxID=78350 RepID=A0A4Y7RIP7_9FIRM|nr:MULTISPECIES: hypothetical protein [Pelotomaculum]TEB08599.1 hypothetical protein Psch_02165 [Pelotomaculum schinkii]TEB16796.1 hypothetical protein Psfp_00958 [Pelotomaculum sp. FP]